MTETAKQLAAQKNAESGPGLTRKLLEREATIREREEFQARVLAEVSRQIDPLSEAIAIQSREARQNTADLSRMSQRTQEALQGTLEQSRTVTRELREAIQGFTVKAIVTLVVTSVLVGVLSAFVFSRTSQTPSEDREAATHWRALEARFQALSPAKQNLVNGLLFSNPKH